MKKLILNDQQAEMVHEAVTNERARRMHARGTQPYRIMDALAGILDLVERAPAPNSYDVKAVDDKDNELLLTRAIIGAICEATWWNVRRLRELYKAAYVHVYAGELESLYDELENAKTELARWQLWYYQSTGETAEWRNPEGYEDETP